MNYTKTSRIFAAVALALASSSLLLASQPKSSALNDYIQAKYCKKAPQQAQQAQAGQQQPAQDPAQGNALYQYIQAKYCKNPAATQAKK